MEWDRMISVIPEVIQDLKSEYTLINPMIRDDIFGILEKHCIVVYYPLFNEKNCGFHTKRFIKDKREDFVYINTAKPIAEQVFTAAHELGHVWGVADKILSKIDTNICLECDDEEKLINRFAAELLMPEKEFRNLFFLNMKELSIVDNKIKIEDFIRIIVMQMNDFMVPYESVRRRMVETSLITEEVGKLLDKNVEFIQALVSAFSKDLNTILDNVTEKKTIPGLRALVDQIEQGKLLDEYTLCKVKKDFDIDSILGTDTIIDIKIGDSADGED